MNNKELQAARKLLMLEVSEAAELIGKVSVRSWQYWESGRSAVPDDVETEILDLLTIRGMKIDSYLPGIEAGEVVQLPFYNNFEQFEQANPGQNRVSWRIEQSVAAALYTEGHAELI